MSLQPRTKAAVMSAIQLAIGKSGGIEEAATLFGLNALRFSAVVDGKADVPPQWVDAFIAYGNGRVGANGFKVIRNHAIAHAVSAASAARGKKTAKTSSLSRSKLIRIDGQLRLLEPENKLPHGAVYVDTINNKSVYMDGRLKDKYMNTPYCEVRYLSKPEKKAK
jgi:hypothetical protein